MAKGGGTGSRNKQKKKSEPTVNGTMNGAHSEQKPSKSTKHRKQKEETPPINPVEEEPPKEEKVHSKLQPTSEQLRLANLTQDSTLDPQWKDKVGQVVAITEKTEDEAATALFDCSWDVQQAIELLLEKGGDLGSWEETGKKKKKKQDKDERGVDGKENEDWDTDNFEPSVRPDGDQRDKSRGRGPPRFKRGGGGVGTGASRQDNDQWKNKEWQENERNFEGGRGRGGRGMGSRARGTMPPRQRGRGGGPRQFGTSGGVGGGGMGTDSGPFGQIDTWNPNPDETNKRGKMSNRDAFENAGNWGDDFPAAEDWDNDEYTGSLSDTKVFTPSGTTTKSAVGEPVNSAPTLSGASYTAQLDLSTLLPKVAAPTGPSAAPGGPTGASLGASALSQYNQTATQDLKTAIGIGVTSSTSSGAKGSSDLTPGYGSSALSYSSGASSSQFTSGSTAGSNFGSAAPGSAFSPIKPAAVTNGSAGSKALPRARLPPPSKIPSSAVEMPGDSLSNLDVQFGGLDLQFGGNSEASSASVSGAYDFSGGSSALSSAASKDLESKYSIPVTSSEKPSLDSYKSSAASVKDVNQSLNNALSAAGIKPSGVSTDSVGYTTSQRTESKPSSNFAAQRSPGPQGLERSKPPAVSDSLGGYQNSGYPYQSSGQSKSSGGQFSNSYQSSNSYDRPSSSGYSSTNGLSASSYGGGSSSGGGYSGNSASSNSSYAGQGSSGSAGLSNNSSGYNSAYNVSTTSYSSYTGSSNSYSSNNAYTTSHSQYPTTDTGSSASTTASTGTSVTGSGYPSNNFSLTTSVSGKMSVNSTGSNKMLPNIPPGVASMIPQYMIGAGAGAGFPAYLASLQQPMYGYGGVGGAPPLGGVSGQQLEDLAALQRSTLANLPQLVGSGSQATNSKGPSTGGYYDPTSGFGAGSSLSTTRGDASSFSDTNKFGQTGSGVTDTTSSPIPSTVAQPTPFNALASTFAAAPTQHPTLPPGYAYFYGGMAPQLHSAYGQTGVYPTPHPGIVPTAAGTTATTQFQKQGYASSYNNYDSLALGGNSNDYGKSNFASQSAQGKSSNSNTGAHWYGGGSGTVW